MQVYPSFINLNYYLYRYEYENYTRGFKHTACVYVKPNYKEIVSIVKCISRYLTNLHATPYERNIHIKRNFAYLP